MNGTLVLLACDGDINLLGEKLNVAEALANGLK
jgi:hypothetical protein